MRGHSDQVSYLPNVEEPLGPDYIIPNILYDNVNVRSLSVLHTVNRYTQ